MFFLRHNVLSSCVYTLKPKQPEELFKNLKMFFQKPSFFHPWLSVCIS